MSQMIIVPGALKRIILLSGIMLIVAACGSAPAAPQAVVQTQVVVVTAEPQKVVQTVEVQKEVVVTPTVAPEEKFQLTFLNGCFPSSQAVTDLMMAAFGATHPGIDVKIDCAVGDYAEGIFAKAAAEQRSPSICRMQWRRHGYLSQ